MKEGMQGDVIKSEEPSAMPARGTALNKRIG